MTLSELLRGVRSLADAVDKALRGIKEGLAKTDKDSDPSQYIYQLAQESILAGAKKALLMVEEAAQQAIADHGGDYEVSEELAESFEIIREFLEKVAPPTVSGPAKNMEHQQ